MRLFHFFTYYRSLGGVQSILKRHHASDAKRGHDPDFLFAFEPDDFDEPDIAGLGYGGGHSIRSMRAKFAKHSGRFTDSVAVCHNMWGLQFLADLMPADSSALAKPGKRSIRFCSVCIRPIQPMTTVRLAKGVRSGIAARPSIG